MLDSLPYPVAFALFILGFGFLIFVHELGHFLVAKWVGIRCPQFAIGFGPAMISWRRGIGVRFGSTEPEYEKRAAQRLAERGKDPEKATIEEYLAVGDGLGFGETEYRLNYLPLGGYVKMLGQEDMDASARSSDPRAFNNKSVGARFAVISAGVIMNMIFGAIFFIVAFMAGVEFPPAVAGGVDPSLPAATAYPEGYEGSEEHRGIRVGDRFVTVNGREPIDWTDVRIAAALGAAETPVELVVQRPGVAVPLIYNIVPEVDPVENLLSLGIDQPLSLNVARVREGGAAHEAGVEPGMRLVEVAGEPVDSYAAFHQIITAARGEALQATFVDADGDQRVTAPVQAVPLRTGNLDEPLSIAGFAPPVRVGRVVEESAADDAGVQPGDIIAELGGVAWPTMERLPTVVRGASGQALELTVLREGELVSLGSVQPRNHLLGIEMSPAFDAAIVSHTVEGSPAAAAGVPTGSRLVSFAGQPIASLLELQQALQTLPTEEAIAVPLTYRLSLGQGVAGESVLPLSPEQLREHANVRYAPSLDIGFDMLRSPVQADGPIQAAGLGLEKTRQVVQQSYMMILRLAQRTVGAEQLHGPVGIVYVGAQVTQRGWTYFIYFLGLISVSLAVINFLPIPIADGGHAVFLAIEKIKGSPVNPKIQLAAMYVGLVLLAGVFLFVTYNDIFHHIGVGQ